MPITRNTVFTLILTVFCLSGLSSYGQLGTIFDIKKPQGYEERPLKSELSETKKFTLPRRFFQNTFTHYNYFFNANNKLNEILERARGAHKDDYSRLLSFYNYSLDMTAKDTLQLDSVQYKAQTGIALHDLRSDWADNLYIIWGVAYHLKKEFDSAYLMFQFINYAYAPKEKDGYYKTIGSGMDGNNAFSISTKEKKRNFFRRAFSLPPSRNDAFIWQIRNFLASDQYAEAASLIVTLRNDPNFPKRLKDDLHEVQSYWFYLQNNWDSAAPHLVKALSVARTKQEKARWEYLAAQLFERSGNFSDAEKYYARSIKHTTDPILDIYARLNSIRANKSGGDNNIEKNIAQLLKMARRDKYESYRDIIYYTAAQMELERNNLEGTMALLSKSVKYNSGDPSQRNKSFLQLAEISYNKKNYRLAYNFYDSLKLPDPAITDAEAIKKRKTILGKIATTTEIIERQDSLLRIAALPEEERKDFVKKLVRQLRKQQGLKEEGTGFTPIAFGQNQAPAPLIFPGQDARGEWYFYNASLRSRGSADFKAKWGNRPNADNWRRLAAISTAQNQPTKKPADTTKTGLKNVVTEQKEPKVTELSFEALYDNLPLTEEKKKITDDSLQAALLELGKIYIREIEDCNTGTDILENLRKRFPNFEKTDELLFNLYYCYQKGGETAKASAIKKLMDEQFPKSNFTTIVSTRSNPQSTAAGPQATKDYEKIYDLFIEGQFSEAVRLKKLADSAYGDMYWTPQLLYIEAVYYIRQNEDSTAITLLNSIVKKFAGTPLAARASTLATALGKRSKIEEELRNLVITLPKEETKPANVNPVINPAVVNPTINPVQQPQKNITAPVSDTTSKKTITPVASPFNHNPDAAHYVMLIMTKVAPVFINEARNAFFRYNRESFTNKPINIELIDMDADNRLLLMSPFKTAGEAIAYVDRAKPLTPSEIIPWLKSGKYTFSIITDKNLELLKAGKDIPAYQNFISQYYPGKF